MSEAKWHPASGQLGWLGDYGEGHEGSRSERAAYSAAQKGLTALTGYESQIKDRKDDLGEYYSGAEERIGAGYDLQRDQVGVARDQLGIQREQLGVQREGIGIQESSALTSFLGDAYSLRSKADVGRATGGLAFSGGQERGVERQRATMSDLMQSRQEQFDVARKGLDISGRGLDISGKGLDIKLDQLDLSETGDLADMARQYDIDLAGIEDMLYQLETERISYEGVEAP
jgi:hypothetical protein|tara:strand:- start:81 stop:770 length:690 start_codon:yes stop_codon:yes gene_type:complete